MLVTRQDACLKAYIQIWNKRNAHQTTWGFKSNKNRCGFWFTWTEDNMSDFSGNPKWVWQAIQEGHDRTNRGFGTQWPKRVSVSQDQQRIPVGRVIRLASWSLTGLSLRHMSVRTWQANCSVISKLTGFSCFRGQHTLICLSIGEVVARAPMNMRAFQIRV